VTAAIGILVGIGFWFAAIVGTAATLIVLALFRFLEAQTAERILRPPHAALCAR
jgi:uncharacterized membrane protein YhiD involved in acid resistance